MTNVEKIECLQKQCIVLYSGVERLKHFVLLDNSNT